MAWFFADQPGDSRCCMVGPKPIDDRIDVGIRRGPAEAEANGSHADPFRDAHGREHRGEFHPSRVTGRTRRGRPSGRSPSGSFGTSPRGLGWRCPEVACRPQDGEFQAKTRVAPPCERTDAPILVRMHLG
jgi:hypothetical protein